MHQHAERELRAIRTAMERAGSYTALPGWGGIGMGVIGVAAAWRATGAQDPAAWLSVWLIAAAIAVPLGAWALAREARRAQVDLSRGVARLFVFNLAPPLLVGAALSAALWRAGAVELLPATWLLLYGLAILAAGAFSLRVLAPMGAAFIALGAVAGFVSPAVANLLLGAGFGALHLVVGVIVLRGDRSDAHV